MNNPGVPQAVRDGATDCLRLIAVIGRQFEGALPPLRRVLAMTDTQRIIDLGSGGGGPWLALRTRLRTKDGTPMPITLTDLFPNQQALLAAQAKAPAQIDFVATPVDATNVPEELQGLRTLFTAFHHFDPPTAQAILQDAVERRPGALPSSSRRAARGPRSSSWQSWCRLPCWPCR